jgi:hypothetical protein
MLYNIIFIFEETVIFHIFVIFCSSITHLIVNFIKLKYPPGRINLLLCCCGRYFSTSKNLCRLLHYLEYGQRVGVRYGQFVEMFCVSMHLSAVLRYSYCV